MVMPMISKKRFLLLALLAIMVMSLVAMRKVHSEEEPVVSYLGPAKYYANYSSACIIRVDDFVADPAKLTTIDFNMGKRTVSFQNFQMELINYLVVHHPEARLVFGIITGDASGENNTQLWSLYSELVHKYGWEAASHTRYHLLPPRTADDIAGSIRDIEGNISNYRVYTYIPPYGKVDGNELNMLRKLGIKIVMSDKPLQLKVPSNWYDVHITIKIDGKHPWFMKFLEVTHYLNNRIGGVTVIYTHATSFDWKSPGQMDSYFNETLSNIEDGRTWITVPSELYKYSVESKMLKVVQLNETTFEVSLKKPVDFQPIPVTLKFLVDGRVKAVYFNGTSLPELDSFGYIPEVGYKQIGNSLLISVIPNGVLQILSGGND
ncbi:MAG: hypothetical protein ACP5O5_04755 [Fervidicoccaceae archaeon]